MLKDSNYARLFGNIQKTAKFLCDPHFLINPMCEYGMCSFKGKNVCLECFEDNGCPQVELCEMGVRFWLAEKCHVDKEKENSENLYVKGGSELE